MTITTSERLVVYQGNGTATIFPYDFLIPEAADINVNLYDDLTGTLLEVLAPGTYTVIGLGNPGGGTVTYPLSGTPISPDVDIAIIRTVPFTQELNIDNQGGFYPEVLEQQLDSLEMQIQQIAEVQTRAIIVAPGQEPPSISEVEEAILAATEAADAAADSAASADASENMAQKWAVNPEDVPVVTGPTQYSSYHWAQKSAEAFNTPVASAIHSAQPKPFPADADELGITDSEASWQLKKVTVGQLLQISGVGGAIGNYLFSSATSAPPDPGTVRVNNAVQPSGTVLWISFANLAGNSTKNYLIAQMIPGTDIFLQNRADPTKFQMYSVNGLVTDSGAYATVPVKYKTGQSALVDGPVVLTLGSSGGGVVTTDDAPPSGPTDGTLWFRSTTGQFYCYYDDGTSKQWVQVGASPQMVDNNYRRKTASRYNMVVNGALNVSQEWGNTEGVSGAGGHHAADQFHNVFSAAPAAQGFSRVAANNPSGSQYRLQFRVTTAKASLAAGDWASIETPLEGLNTQDLGWTTPTPKDAVLTFGFKGPAGTYSVYLANDPSAATAAFTTSFTIAAGQANTDTIQTIKVTAPTVKTWKTDNTVAIALGIVLAAGSSVLTPTSGWNSGAGWAITGMSNGLAAVQSFQVWDIGLYADPDKTGLPPPFEIEDYATTLAKCMRYFQPIPQTSWNGYGLASNLESFSITLLAQMRTSPTVGAPSFSYSNSSGGTAIAMGLSTIRFRMTVTATTQFQFDTVGGTVNARM